MELVKQTARTGRNDEMALRSALVSVFMVDADGILEVYGGLSSLRLGLKALGRQLSEPRQVDPETARYASTLIYLEPLLTQDRKMTDTISDAIRDAKEIWDRSTERMDPEVFRLLATAYQQTVSTLKPRIMLPVSRDTFQIRKMPIRFEHCFWRGSVRLFSGDRQADRNGVCYFLDPACKRSLKSCSMSRIRLSHSAHI